jgi:hypothetical protein
MITLYLPTENIAIKTRASLYKTFKSVFDDSSRYKCLIYDIDKNEIENK